MKSIVTALFFPSVVFLMVFGAFLSPAQATLIGDVISADLQGSSQSATIGAGIEFWVQIGGDKLFFDFNDSTLTVSTDSTTGTGFVGYNPFKFYGFDVDIANVAIASTGGAMGPIVDGLSFDDHSITLNIGNDGGIPSVVLRPLTFSIETESGSGHSPVPVPSTILLLGTGLSAIVLGRKKREGFHRNG